MIVKLLLGLEKVNPHSPNYPSGVPLSRAAGVAIKRAVKLLLRRGDVNPDTLDTVLDQIPLLRAAGGDHKGVKPLPGEKMSTPKVRVNPA